MKEISKELLNEGEVGQLDGVLYKAVARNPNTCDKCEISSLSMADDCYIVKCSAAGNRIYFVKV